MGLRGIISRCVRIRDIPAGNAGALQSLTGDYWHFGQSVPAFGPHCRFCAGCMQPFQPRSRALFCGPNPCRNETEKYIFSVSPLYGCESAIRASHGRDGPCAGRFPGEPKNRRHSRAFLRLALLRSSAFPRGELQTRAMRQPVPDRFSRPSNGGATAETLRPALFQRHSRMNDPALVSARRPGSRCAFHRCHA